MHQFYIISEAMTAIEEVKQESKEEVKEEEVKQEEVK